MSSINGPEQQQQQQEEEQSHVCVQGEAASPSRPKLEAEVLACRTSDKASLEDNLFLPSRQSQGLSASFSQSAEIFQELQQECMRRLNVPAVGAAHSGSGADAQDGRQDGSEDRPQIPPRVPIPPRPVKRGDYSSARWSQDLSLSPTLAEPGGDVVSDSGKDRPPQVPPRDPFSQPGSRTPSPMGLVVGSPQQRVYSVSPTAASTLASGAPYSSYLSTSPAKHMPTTHSFGSDPKYAAPKVIQAQGRDGASRGPCILPIIRDGRKVSSTHYYLLPERPPYLDRYDRFFREAESLPPPGSGAEERQARQANTATVRPLLVGGQVCPGPAQGASRPVQPSELKANFSSNNNSSLGGLRPAMKTSVSLPRVCSDVLTGQIDAGGNSADRVRLVGFATPLDDVT